MPSTEENVNNSPEQFRLLEEKCAALEKKVSELEDKIETLFSQTSSHSIGLPLTRDCCSIQVSLTIKRSWQPLNI